MPSTINLATASKAINTNVTVNITPITPIHIGSGEELKRGIHYLPVNGKTYLINRYGLSKKLIALGRGKENPREYIERYSQLLIENDTKKLKSFLLEELPKKEEGFDFHAKEITFQNPYDGIATTDEGAIKEFIRTGINHQPFIPGSSIKGAIRSAVFHYLVSNDKQTKERESIKDREKRLLGDFKSSIFKYIKTTDAIFIDNDLQLSEVKIFNLYAQKTKWISRYHPTLRLFVESIKSEAKVIGSFRLGVSAPLIQKLLAINAGYVLHDNTAKIINLDFPIQYLFKIINAHTLNHIEQEIEFFKHYNEVLDAHAIIDKLGQIKTMIEKAEQECVLRIGSGNGFHGITGDWQFNHIDTIEQKLIDDDFSREFYKSRKIIGGMPMGFVKLSLKETLPIGKTEQIKIPFKHRKTQSIQQKRPMQEKQSLGLNKTMSDIDLASIVPNKTIFYVKVTGSKSSGAYPVKLLVNGVEVKARLIGTKIAEKKGKINQGDILKVVMPNKPRGGNINKIQVKYVFN